MDRVMEASQFLREEIEARIDALRLEADDRLVEIDRLSSTLTKLNTLPLWGDRKAANTECCLIGRDDDFGHLTMAQAAQEILARAGEPMHAKTIWFQVMNGGYPHHSRTSFQALVTCMNRLKSRFLRVAPNTFALVAAADEREQTSSAATRPQDNEKKEYV